MGYYRIPMLAAPQKFSVRLAGVTYEMTALYRNTEEGGWVLDIRSESSQDILLGVPLVTGLDLLDQYAYLEFGGELYVATDGDLLKPPAFGELGTTSYLYFWTEDS